VSHPSFGTSSAKSIMTHCHLLVFGRRSQEWFASPDDNQHGLIIRGLVMDSFSPTTGIHKQPRRQLLTSTLGILFVQFSICNTCLCLAVWRTSRTTICDSSANATALLCLIRSPVVLAQRYLL